MKAVKALPACLPSPCCSLSGVLLFRSAMHESRSILERELQSMGISPRVAFAADGYQIKQALTEFDTDAVIGSAWEKYMAAEERTTSFAFRRSSKEGK